MRFPARAELRALTWDHVDLNRGVIHVWRSTRRDGDTKTPKSRRSLVLPRRAIDTLRAHRRRQVVERLAAGEARQDTNLVFCHEDGRQFNSDALNWRFSKMTRQAGIGHWHAHEGRHTAVSIVSTNGVPIQDISVTVGAQVHPRHRGRIPARDRSPHPGRRERYGQRVP
jgi:integrase